MKNIFVNIEDLMENVPTFYRMSCKTCREVKLLDENGKFVDKREATSGGAIIEEITTKSGDYNCEECMKKIFKNHMYDKEVQTERFFSETVRIDES